MPFSKYNMPSHHLGPCQSSDSESPRWGLRFRIPDVIPGKANATGPWTTLGVARLSVTFHFNYVRKTLNNLKKQDDLVWP